MSSIQIRDMQPDDEYFVGTCSHVNESEEADAVCRRRLVWLKKMEPGGLRVKVAVEDNKALAFAYVMPIEISPWGPLAEELMVMNCLYVPQDIKGRSIGRRLANAALEETRRQGRKGLVTEAYYWEFWFMPAPYFEKLGFEVVTRKDNYAILWMKLDETARPPVKLKRNYTYQPVEGRVVVDLFHHSFCATVNTEAQRVREVCAEYGDKVVLNEYNADDPVVLRKHQIPRAIFVNGKEIGWGYEAPKDGIRKAIEEAG